MFHWNFFYLIISDSTDIQTIYFSGGNFIKTENNWIGWKSVTSAKLEPLIGTHSNSEMEMRDDKSSDAGNYSLKCVL